jgi:hypothetical protein
MKDDRPDCTTFEQYILTLFKLKKTDSLEFKTMLEIFGKDKLIQIWKKFKKSGDQ